MNNLLKLGIKAAAAVVAAIGLAWAYNKYSGQAEKINIVPADAAGAPDKKKIGILAGAVALGAVVVAFLAKTLKLNFLK